MSLINQVLRDLDARHAPSVDRVALPEVHPLPPEPSRPWPRLIAAAVAVGGLAWYLLVAPAQPPESSPPVVVPVPLAPPAQAAQLPAQPVAAPAIVPEVPLPAPAAVAPMPAAAKPVAAAPKSKGSAALRLETRLPLIGESAAVPPSAPVAPAAKPTQTTDAAAVAATIDKRLHTAPANEAAEADYRKAMAALRRGAVSDAVDGLRKALRTETRHISARQALLSLLVEQQQWNEAQSLMEEGLALDPAQTGWAMALARLQFEHGKLAEAVETLSRHAAHAEQHADYQAFLALLLQKQKRPAEAAQRYRAALALKPNESRWWYGLGLVLESEQKPQEARAAFLKARETGNLTPDVLNAVEQRLR